MPSRTLWHSLLIGMNLDLTPRHAFRFVVDHLDESVKHRRAVGVEQHTIVVEHGLEIVQRIEDGWRRLRRCGGLLYR